MRSGVQMHVTPRAQRQHRQWMRLAQSQPPQAPPAQPAADQLSIPEIPAHSGSSPSDPVSNPCSAASGIPTHNPNKLRAEQHGSCSSPVRQAGTHQHVHASLELGSAEAGNLPAPGARSKEASVQELPLPPTSHQVLHNSQGEAFSRSLQEGAGLEHKSTMHAEHGPAKQQCHVSHQGSRPQEPPQKRKAAAVVAAGSGSQPGSLEPDTKRMCSFQGDATGEGGLPVDLSPRPHGEAEGDSCSADADAVAAQAAAACGEHLWDTVGAVCCNASGIAYAYFWWCPCCPAPFGYASSVALQA